MIIGETRCCGVLEIDGLSAHLTPKEAMLSIADRLRNRCGLMPVPFIYFTGVVALGQNHDSADHARNTRTDDYGTQFSNYIYKHRLGTVISTEPRKSWSGNTLRMWIWEPDYTRLFPHLDTLEKEYGS